MSKLEEYLRDREHEQGCASGFRDPCDCSQEFLSNHAEATAELTQLKDEIEQRRKGSTAASEALVNSNIRLEQLRRENIQLTDALYKEAIRTVKAFALIMKVLEADETDQWDALDIEPFVKWIENFPKETLNGRIG